MPVKAEAANNNAQNIGASDNKWANIYATTFNGALAGNASSASTAYSAAVIPTANHYLEFQSSPGTDSGNATLRHHSTFYVKSNVSDSATSTAWSELFIGNATATGTAGNSRGWIKLFSQKTTGTEITSLAETQNNIFYVPDYSGNGYAVTAAQTSAEGGNTQPVYIAANGRATKLTYTANRLYYSASTSSFAATSHYASASKIGVNITTEPSYNLYVSGTEYVSSTATINGALTGNSTIQGKGKIVAGANLSSGARTELQTTGSIDLYNAGSPEIDFHTANVSTSNAKIIADSDCIKFVFT